MGKVDGSDDNAVLCFVKLHAISLQVIVGSCSCIGVGVCVCVCVGVCVCVCVCVGCSSNSIIAIAE